MKHRLRYTTIVTKQRIKTGLLLARVIGLVITIHKLTQVVIESARDLYLLYMKVSHAILSMLALVGIASLS